MVKEFRVAEARDQFPALSNDQVFCDNAGGSQVLGTVAKSIADYLLNANVQLGASYKTSRQSTAIFDQAYSTAAKYVNAQPDEVVFGASTTQVLRNLASALVLGPSDELVLSELDHESNIDPWLHAASMAGAAVKWWRPRAASNPTLDPATLRDLMTPRTKLVACTHASNILGTVHDIKAIAAVVHEIPGAMLCVDGVAYAPHRHIDVKDLGADFYALSWYKVYGPHMSLLYGSKEAQESLRMMGHFFNPSNTLADKLEMAAGSYELLQSVMPLVAYFGPDPKQAWAAIEKHEQTLQARLLAYLTSRADVTVHGSTNPSSDVRVSTVSFTVKGRSSQSVVEAVEAISNIGIRWGHFFSQRLAEKTLGLGEDGVVRVSMVHYNTVEEVDRICQALEKVLASKP